MPRRSEALRIVLALATVAGVTLVYTRWLHVSSAATVSTTFLLIVLVVAATSRLWAAVTTSLAAMFCLNFFFLPPVGTLTIADPQNWVALFAFLAVSLIASNLSAVARARTDEAIGRRDELARLFDLSRDVLVITDSRQAISAIARATARRFYLAFVAIALPRADEWELFAAGTRSVDLDHRELTHAFAAAQASFEFDAQARTYAGHRTTVVGADIVRLVPLRVGTRPVGLLAATGRPVEPGTLDALAGVVAIAIERAKFLEERKSAELTRQSEELKASLLASLGHDLRTPLTAIRIAAGNIKSAGLDDENRAEQSDVILIEAERLTRLFENILEMARIDAGAVATHSRWVHPSEIIASARGQVEQSIRTHALIVEVDPDVPVKLDPRLTAAALARVLENAAHYSPPGSTIHVGAGTTADGLEIHVRDHGAGIAAADLAHVFDRFSRGAAASQRTTGTGMGLSIARGLLAAEGGRIWAENDPDGGSRFTIAVPAATRDAAVPASSPE
jgi:two-component system sensor histidine kinase KdpD